MPPATHPAGPGPPSRMVVACCCCITVPRRVPTRSLAPAMTADYAASHDCHRPMPLSTPGPCGCAAAPPTSTSGTACTALWWPRPARSRWRPPCCLYWASWMGTLTAIHARIALGCGTLAHRSTRGWRRTHAVTPRSHPGGGVPNHTELHSSGLERGYVRCAPPPCPTPPCPTGCACRLPPRLATSARSRRTLLTCPLRPAPCCSRKLDRNLPEHLQSCNVGGCCRSRFALACLAPAAPAPTPSSRPAQLPRPRRT